MIAERYDLLDQRSRGYPAIIEKMVRVLMRFCDALAKGSGPFYATQIPDRVFIQKLMYDIGIMQ